MRRPSSYSVSALPQFTEYSVPAPRPEAKELWLRARLGCQIDRCVALPAGHGFKVGERGRGAKRLAAAAEGCHKGTHILDSAARSALWGTHAHADWSKG